MGEELRREDVELEIVVKADLSVRRAESEFRAIEPTHEQLEGSSIVLRKFEAFS